MMSRRQPDELAGEFEQLRTVYVTLTDSRQRETFRAKLAEIADAWRQHTHRPSPAATADLHSWR